MAQESIYLDNNATTPLLPGLKEEVLLWLNEFGNPSSVHAGGRAPKRRIREARQILSKTIGAHPLEVLFTSGGSEANNLAIGSVFRKLTFEKKASEIEFITSEVEHPSVGKVFDRLETLGVKVHRIPVDRDGVFHLEKYTAALNSKTALVSVMVANNEIGNLLPLTEVVRQAHAVGARVHCDGVQALGKLDLSVKELGVDYCSFSAHKLYSLKGCGALYVKSGAPIEPMIYGGAQERRRRAGTENTLAIASFGYVLKRMDEVKQAYKRCEVLRDKMEERILSSVSDVHIVAANSERLPNTSNIMFSGIEGETLMMNLDLKGVYLSTGAACSSGSSEPSPVLQSMGYSRTEAQSSLRISLGWFTTEADIDRFGEILIETVERLRRLKRAMNSD